MQKSKSKQALDAEQLMFVVEAILIGALERIAMPDEITWEEWKRSRDVAEDSTDYPTGLSVYERGGLEACGMALGVLYAQLANDGLGIYDALACAGKFGEACNNLADTVWADTGEAVRKRIAMFKSGVGIDIRLDVYERVHPGAPPDTAWHAQEFVAKCFPELFAIHVAKKSAQ